MVKNTQQGESTDQSSAVGRYLRHVRGLYRGLRPWFCVLSHLNPQHAKLLPGTILEPDVSDDAF